MTISNCNDEEEYKIAKQQAVNQTLAPLLRHYQDVVKFIWIGKKSRRRVTFQVDKNNNLGFFLAKTNKLIIVEDYDLATLAINSLITPLKKIIKKIPNKIITQIVVTNFDNGLDVVLRCNEVLQGDGLQILVDFAQNQHLNLSFVINDNLFPLYLLRKNQIIYDDVVLDVASDVFVQPTKEGLNCIIQILQAQLLHNNAKNIVDLFAGFGIYTFALNNKIKAHFQCYEGMENMVKIIQQNVTKHHLKNIKFFNRDLFNDPVTLKDLKNIDNVIINPPRNGALPQIIELARASIANIQYVSCNPQTFVRDAKILIDSNYSIVNIYALDQFYATNHCEIITCFSKKIKL